MITLKLIRLDPDLNIYDSIIIDKVIETDVVINKSVELNETFEYSLSFSTLKFLSAHGQDEVILSTSSIARYIIGVEVLKNNSCIFWGQLDSDSVEYDEINEIYSLTIVDWFKFIKAYWNDIGAEVNFQNVPLLNILKMRLPAAIAIDVELPVSDQAALSYVPETMQKLQIYQLLSDKFHFYVNQYLTELQKRFGAYCYISANKTFRIVGRSFNINTEIDLTDFIIDADISRQEFVLSDYDSVLANYYYQLGNNPWKHGWVWVYGDRTRTQRGHVIITDLNNASVADGHKVLDLREKVVFNDGNGEFTFGFNDNIYTLFPERSLSEIWGAYRGYINPHRLHKLKVATTELDLFYKVKYLGHENLFIWEAKINHSKEETDLTLMEFVD